MKNDHIVITSAVARYSIELTFKGDCYTFKITKDDHYSIDRTGDVDGNEDGFDLNPLSALAIALRIVARDIEQDKGRLS